jgi:hypothetical protein
MVTTQFPDEKILIEQETLKLKSLYFQALIDTRQRMKDQLTMNLGAYVMDPEQLVKYPFLQDVPRMVNDYIDCFEVIQDNKMISLVIDTEKLSQKGLPENLSTLIEYGDEAIPSFSHIRSVLQTVQPIFKQVLEGLIKVSR